VHWEVAAHLIVVVVWDVGTKSGVKAGKSGFTLTNEHQRVPTSVTLVAKREGDGVRVHLHLGVRHPVPDIFQTRAATELLLALHAGTRMRLVQRETGKLIVEVPKDFAGRSLESLQEWKPFLDKLCFVQRRIYSHGTIRISKGRVSRRAAQFVEVFYSICTKGFIERSLSFKAEFDLTEGTWQRLISLARNGERVEMGFDVPDAGDMKILNVKVPLGPMRARQDIRIFAEQVEKALSNGRKSVKVKVPAMIVREEYPDWTPPDPSG
jgi:hypothetical protein